MFLNLFFGIYKYRSTLNRRYNELLKNNIIDNIYTTVLNEYTNNNSIYNLYIDSTDVMNYNCSKSILIYHLNYINKL